LSTSSWPLEYYTVKYFFKECIFENVFEFLPNKAELIFIGSALFENSLSLSDSSNSLKASFFKLMRARSSSVTSKLLTVPLTFYLSIIS